MKRDKEHQGSEVNVPDTAYKLIVHLVGLIVFLVAVANTCTYIIGKFKMAVPPERSGELAIQCCDIAKNRVIVLFNAL